MHLRRSCGKWLQVVAVVGLLGVSTGCDPTLKASIENGIISVSTSFFGAFLQAMLALATESATTGTTTGTTNGTTNGTTPATTTGGTVMLLSGVAEPVFA